MVMVQCLIKGYIESTQIMIVIIIYKHIEMYINMYYKLKRFYILCHWVPQQVDKTKYLGIIDQ